MPKLTIYAAFMIISAFLACSGPTQTAGQPEANLPPHTSAPTLNFSPIEPVARTTEAPQRAPSTPQDPSGKPVPPSPISPTPEATTPPSPASEKQDATPTPTAETTTPDPALVSTPTPPLTTPTSVPVTPTPGAGTSLTITVIPVAGDIPQYSRSQWKHWADADGDCQDARQEVLIAESLVEVTFQTPKECRVGTGRWYGAFTGTYVDVPGDLDVDHLVP